jgi:hypothetical protein
MHKIFPRLRKRSGDTNRLERVGNSTFVKLSPLARLYWTLDLELKLDPTTNSDEPRYLRYVRMQQAAEQKRDQLLRNIFVADALILLLLFGKTFTIPGLGMSLNEIPAAREALTLFSSLAFQLFANAFVSWQGYAAIIDTINRHKARVTGIDPDYLSASDKFLEFVPKLYRPKMNIYGQDFLKSCRGYNITSKLVTGLMTVSVFSFLCLHLTVITLSARQSIHELSGLFAVAYFTFLLASTVGGLLLLIANSTNFKFEIGDEASKQH